MNEDIVKRVQKRLLDIMERSDHGAAATAGAALLAFEVGIEQARALRAIADSVERTG